MPPIVVLQADHGPGSELDWWSLPRTNVHERFAILNALLLPGIDASLPARLSPVNTFRLILNEYLGADLEMLPDRSYYTVLTHPYHYFDVTDPERLPPWPDGLDLSAFGRRAAPEP